MLAERTLSTEPIVTHRFEDGSHLQCVADEISIAIAKCQLSVQFGQHSSPRRCAPRLRETCAHAEKLETARGRLAFPSTLHRRPVHHVCGRVAGTSRPRCTAFRASGSC